MAVWTPAGRMFPPEGYGALPFAVPDGPAARVFFSGRSPENRSSISACTVDLERLTVEPASRTPEPLLSPGPLGTFDDSGCSVSCVVRHGGRWYLYYTGWMLGRTVPFYLAIGLATSDDGGATFQKTSLAPVVDRNHVDPFLTASPSVLFDEGRWRMWYVSAVGWELSGGEPRHRYLIKYAESDDGVSWRRDGRIAVGFADPAEYALGRPHVMRTGSVYRMWFCARGDRYRIAYAESADGLHWSRAEGDAGPPRQDWDAEMQAYPMVVRHEDRWIMFYNGNGYGATGFGCATADADS
jgi:predicted GH43/DUF377 family glycosyl hydrolase